VLLVHVNIDDKDIRYIILAHLKQQRTMKIFPFEILDVINLMCFTNFYLYNKNIEL
jgi:hypothetical protein